MIEGIRQSVLEEGYILSLPENLGDHNGISNDHSTREFVGRHIGTEDQIITGFKPHSHAYKFPNQYSRAEQGLAMKPVAAYSPKGGDTILAGEIDTPWRVKKIELKELVRASMELKNGSEEDKLRYIPAMEVVKAAGLEPDPVFEQVLSNWIMDKTQSFALRRQVLMYEWTQAKKSLPKLLDQFDQTEQVNLLQNLLDTPRYKDLVLKRKSDLPGLMVKTRTSKKVRQAFIDKYDARYKDTIEGILDNDKISGPKAEAAIASIASSLGSVRIAEVVRFEDALKDTPLEEWAKEQTINAFVRNIFTESQLVSEVMENVSSSDPAVRDFIARGFDTNGKLKDFELLASSKEILTKFNGDIEAWILAESTTQEAKARVLEGMYTLEGKKFKQIYKRLNSGDQAFVSRWIDRHSARALFEQMAVDQKLPKDILAKMGGRSFQFVGVDLPKEGKIFQLGEESTERTVTLTRSFEMMATPVTQLQWFLVMGGNPSRFKTSDGDGDHLKINEIDINTIHPVETVSWEDAQSFIKKLNAMSTEYEYRLPTEAEWEAAARAGTQTKFSFGDSEQALAEYGWSHENSEGRTHSVALKQPNPAGLYDIHGNVWEWTQDWYAEIPGGGQDPQGPDTGSYRVLRGGSWSDGARILRSACRGDYGPGGRFGDVGFRLVRTKK